MRLATTILTHDHVDVTKDTVESVKMWMTDNVLVVVDLAGWKNFEGKQLGTKMIPGLHHGHHKSPYRNYVFSLHNLVKEFPDCDWYAYMEYDVLVVSSGFKNDLKSKAWMMGCDVRTYPFTFPLLDKILDCGKIQHSRYVFGCCHFLHHDFVYRLLDMDFFDRFLKATAKFTDGTFPDYNEYAFEEACFPTIVDHLGGTIKELGCWDEKRGSRMYPIRFNPEMRPDEVPVSASIIHPVKENGILRQHYRRHRERINRL